METTINTTTQEVEQAKYIVSDNTAMFIDLLKKESQLHGCIADTIEEIYGVSLADVIMTNDFYPILLSLRNKIFEHINASIEDNIDENKI